MLFKQVKTIVKKCFAEIKVFFLRDKINLYFSNLYASKNRVNLNYFHSGFKKAEDAQADSGLHNLGDDLSPIVVEYMLKRKGLSLDDKTDKTHNLYAIGSILFMGYQNATVWGSGMLFMLSRVRAFFHNRFFRKLDIRCVRGPLSRKELLKLGHKCPETYGDPACLMPLIYSPKVKKTLDYLVIPHVSMESEIRKIVPEENIASMNTDDYKTVIDKICSSHKVIASSLHGIILSEAYQVPAIFYQDRSSKYNFKYADWYASTGRTMGPTTTNLHQAIDMDVSFVPDLSKMQQDLIESFPYNLWNSDN